MASFTPNYNDDALVVPDMTVAPLISASRKRKRDDDKTVLGGSFVIKPHTSSVFDSSVKLTPAVVLPRSYIPLQWLAGHPSRLFSIPTPLPALDTPGNVLVVKAEGERQLVAVEKVNDGVYTLCKLSTQLKMKDVRKTFAQAKKSRQNPESFGCIGLTSEMLSSEWWSDLAVPDFSIETSCVSESTIKFTIGLDNHDTGLPSQQVPPYINMAPSPPAATSAGPERLETFKEPTLADTMEKTGVQYFKTLYIAKTSLAYFAKSTLSRARVTMQQEDMLIPLPNSGSKLRAFLMEMYLPFDKMDIKYRKSIPQIATEDQVEDMSVFKPGEEMYVQQWRASTWQEKLVQASDPTLKCKVEELKIRETELQIIILLEVLALEREQTTSTKGSITENSRSKSKIESKNRRKRKQKTGVPDPKLLLDLLVDRLCIWRSIGSGTDGLEEESSGQKKITDREHDHLRHFCVEVVLAFYASRLPEECASINKKCGGSNSRQGFDSPNQVGAKKAKRSTKTPSLLRSITTPTAPTTREASVDTLAALVAADSRGTVRGGTLNSKSFAKREVQISSRGGQQRKVDEELKEAIDVLKKPNRAAVASELVNESAKRLSQKLKKTTKNPLAKVQVMATPKRRRTISLRHQNLPSTVKDATEPSPHDPFYVFQAPNSRTRCDVPGTPLRRNGLTRGFDTIPPTSPLGPAEDRRLPVSYPISGEFATPQKKPHRLTGTGLGSSNFILSTTKAREIPPRSPPQPAAPLAAPNSVPQNPFQPMDDISSPVGGVRLFNDDTVGETPSKPTTIPARLKIAADRRREVSIYDSLGWDDDYDL